jgi:DNA-binding transcriptional LysR family regulator
MKLERIDLNLLKVFEIIYQEGNLTRASEILNITQPAVSNSLRRLRETLNDPLFVHTPSGMLPTPVAKSMIDRVRDALQLLDIAVNQNIKFDPQSSTKRYRFSMNDFSDSVILPRLQQELNRSAAGVVISSYYVAREQAEKHLATGQLDFVVDTPLPAVRNLSRQLLPKDEYVCAMRPENQLAKQKLTIERYLDAKHIHVSGRQTGRGHADMALAKLGYKRKVSMRVQHYFVAGRVTAQNDLLWTVPKGLAEQLPLVIKPLPFEIQSLGSSLYWHSSTEQDPASRWMRELVTSLFADH